MSNPYVREESTSFRLPVSGVTVTVRPINLREGIEFSKLRQLPDDERAVRLQGFIATIATWDAKHVETGAPIPLTQDAILDLPLKDGETFVLKTIQFIAPPDDPKGD